MVDKIISRIVDDLIGVKNRLQQNAVFFWQFSCNLPFVEFCGNFWVSQKVNSKNLRPKVFAQPPRCLSKGTSSATRASLEDSSAVTP